MPQQLVADVWLRGVHGLGAMADVLGGVEDSEGQPRQEVSGRQETCRDKRHYRKNYELLE